MSKEEANIDDAIEFYSKKWGVSKEEAAEKIKKLIEARKAPSMEDLFPEPLGELSKKVQDINQSILSTAATRRRVQELENPPRQSSGVEKSIGEAVEEAGKNIITEKLTKTDPIRAKVDEYLADLVGRAVKEKLEGGGSAEKELAAIRQKEQLDNIIGEFSEKVVGPLAKRMEELEAGGKGKGKGEFSEEEAVDLVMGAQEKYKKFLEDRGYKVESVNITKDEVSKIVKDEVAKEKEKWEKESGTQVEVEKERIQATEKILTGVTDRVFDIFLEPIKGKIQEAIEKGAFARKG
jgi:hypothetical protein